MSPCCPEVKISKNCTFSTVADSVSESATLRLSARAKALQAQGKAVVSLTAGEPHLPPPTHITDALIAAATNPVAFQYTAQTGIQPLREAVAEQMSLETGRQYSAKNVIITAGTKPPLFLLFLTLLNPGDEVLIPAPYWVSYPEQVKMARGTPVVIPTTRESEYRLTPELLRNAITPKTKILILNTPCNPTGSVYTESELRALVDVVESSENRIVILSDEIYAHLVFPGVEHCSVASVADEDVPVFIASGWSKDYAVPGARIGYALGPVDIIEKMAALQSHGLGNAPHPMQLAVLGAFSDNLAFPQKLAQYYHVNAVLVHRWATETLGLSDAIMPQGAFYYWLPVEKYFGKTLPSGKVIQTASDMSEELLESALVATVPGEPFGNGTALRLSLAIETTTLQLALTRIDTFVQNLS